MANKKNVEENKKNTEIKNKKSNELEHNKQTKKKKLRLHSHLRVNIPLFQSIMMILPSLAKHAEATEGASDSANDKYLTTANSVVDKDIVDTHTNAAPSEGTHQSTQTNESQETPDTTESQAPHGANTHLVPSHHLSTLSHPQVHYIPSVSMPTISAGGNGQPTHSNTPPTPTTPVTFIPEVIKGTYGELHVDVNGQYTFILNPNSPQYILLNQHQQGTDHFALHLSNGASIVVQIPVTGKQDLPSISGDLTGVVTEDHNIDSQGLLHANGKIDVIDPDQNESSVTPEVISGKYGSLTIDANGHWQYQVDNSLSNVQALTGATSLHESFTIHTKDGTPQTIDMTIGGNDDNAVITGVDAGSVIEDLTTQVQGQLSVTDPDLGEDHFQASQVNGHLGTLTIDKDGAWTYDLDNTNPTVQALGKGATATDTVTVHSADGTPHQITVTVNGTNDKAVIGGTSSGAVTEESQLQTSGTLTITDVDTGEAHFSNTDVAGALGTLHLKDNGAWTYDLDNTNPQVQALGKGATATDTITVHSADGTPHQITVTINGTNDKAVISGTSSGSVKEETQLQTSGTLMITDVDTGEAHFSNIDIIGTFGTLHLTDSGAWSYDLDNTNPAVQALGKGATATDTITVHSADGTSHHVTIIVNGTNDKAVIGGTSLGVVTEESQLKTFGTLTIADVDSGEAHFSNTDVAGALGTLHLKDNGTWTYDLDNTNPQVQALGKGATATDTITVHSADGTPHQITVTVNGTNDKAVIGGTNSGAVTEESQLQISGTLTITDVDTGEAHFSNTDVAGALGTLHLKDNGTWTYDLDNTNPQVQALGKGATATDTITVHSADGTPHQITVTVNGTNDKAVIGGTNSGAVTEESQLQISGTLTITDVDTGEAHFSNTDVAGALGTLHLKDNGTWTYDLDNTNPKVQALGQGSTATDTITVHSADGTPHQITVTVNGTNDKAVIGGTNSGAVTEESQLQTSGTLTVTDVDNGEAHFSNTDVAGALGTLHLTDTGGWTYDLDNTNPKVQALGKGATATDTIIVHSADGTPHQVAITINGTNDKAVIGGTNTGAVTEEAQLQTSGTLTIADVDTGEAHFSNTDVAGALGTLHLKDNGAWTYDLDNTNPKVQALGKGATATDTITVHSADGTAHKVTITVNGTNDKAVIGGTSAGAVTEESQLHTSGTLTVTDVDTGEAHFSNTDIAGALGTLHLTDSGKWTYDLDNTNPTVQALSKGAAATDTITVHSADGTPHQVTITVNGANDKAIIAGTDSGVVTEESQLHTSGTLTVTDVDTGDAHFSNTDIVGSFGTLHLTDSGKWTYDLDNTNPTVQALGKGATATDTITVHSADGTPHQITVTVNGTNDKAVIGGTNSGAVTEESQLQASGTLTITDVDTGEAHFSNTDVAGALGTLHLKDNGTWAYDLDNTNPQVQALGKGATATDTITVHSADGTPHQITVTVNGTNDKAVIGGTNSGAVTEESQLQASGTLTITDVDTGEAHFSNTDVAGALGTLHLKDNGTWAYDLDNTNPQVQALGKGATATDTITVHSADGTPHQVTITVNGTNDKAVIGGTSSGAVTEESQLQTSGTLTITDVDSGEAHFSNTDVAGALGTLHLKDNGTWTYDLDNTNPQVQALGQGSTATDTITVHSADGTPHQITVTVNGTNDKAVIGGTNSGAVTEESQLQTSGTLTVTDVDNGEAHFSNTDVAGALGTLHLTDTGGWTYDLDNTNPKVQALGKGATATDTIIVHSADGTPHQITVTVNGTNDQAVIGGTSSGVVTEESQLQASGTLTITDVDTGEAHFSNTDVVGALGTLHLKDNGAWTYDLDNTNPQVQALRKGATATDTITVHSADGTLHQVTVTINGTNDKAVIGGTNSGAVTEESQLQASGTLTITDVDTGEAHFSNTDVAGALGTLHLKDNGTWAYDLDNTNPQVQALGKGATATDTITVHSADGTPHQITVTVNGTNDKAVIGGTNSGAVTEESQLQTSGTLTITDVDTGEAHFFNTDVAGALGTLHLKDNGAWTYDLDNTNPQVQALSKGATATDTITVHSADGTPHQVTITINGTNDKAVIGGTNSGAVTEESQLQTSGTLTITDVDTGEAHFSNKDVAGVLGTLHLKDNGAWTYDLDNTNPQVQALSKGATATDTITVHSADGTPHQVTITVNGTNDAAVISGDTVKSIHENALFDADKHDVTTRQNAHSLSGTLTSQDADSGQSNLFQPIQSQMGHYGSISLDANGHWQYQLAPSEGKTIDELAQGEHVTEVFTVHSIDGTSHTVSIELMGDNDSASITLQPSRSHTTIFEDKTSDIDTSGALRAYGNVDVTDVDSQGSAAHSEELLKSETAHTAIGGVFTVHGTSWDYQVDPSNPQVQALAAGEKLIETHTITSIDGTASKQVSVTIVGTNDSAVITGTDTGDVTEGNAGQDMSPDFAQPGMAFLGRSTIHTTGKLNITDVDTGEAEFDTHGIGFTYSGQYGDLLLNKDGRWSYHADTGQIRSTGGLTSTRGTTIDQLGENQTLTDTVTVFTKDGTSHDIVITIHGSNDRPYCSSEVQLNSGKEDLAQTIAATELLANTIDVDANDLGKLTIANLHADHGSIRDNNDGTFTFTPDKDYNGQVHFTYDVADAHRGVTHTGASTTLTATTDKAIITDAQTNTDLRGVTEDRGYIDTHYQLHYDGRLNIQDPDAGEAQFDPNIGPQTYQGIGYDTKLGGHILLMRDGHYTYTLDNRNIQNLAQGEVKHDSAVIHSVDGTTHTIELTVHGTNDAPIINAQSHSVTEGGSILNGQMVGHDIDTGATLTYSAPQIDGLVVNPDGSYTFNPAHSSYQSLASGVTKTLTVPVTVTDEHNASSTQNLSITITGVNNSAVIGGVDTGDVTESTAGQNMSPDYAQHLMSTLGRAPLYASGALTITDADSGETTFDSRGLGFNYAGKFGDLLLREDGTWSYYADAGNIRIKGGVTTNRGSVIDQLGEGEILTDTITVYSKDGTSHDIVITIHGSNDRPYCASEVQLNSGKEDSAQTITATELLANTVDVDANDAGKLSIANLHADHGSILDNQDGTYTLTPDKDYNGQVHFTYDVKDAHGGTTHTGANTTLVATPDKAIISEVTTGSVIEDGSHAGHYNGTTTELANGQLKVIDPDSGEDKFQYSQFGETRIHDPFGGILRIDRGGSWQYSVDNTHLQHLAQGQTETVIYRVHSYDGTAYELHIDVEGTNDAPAVTQVALSNGTEDTHYQMQASQFGFTDVDTGDTLHSIAITDLPPAAQGKFVLDGHDITAGQSITAADITKLQFVPAPDFNGDVPFKFTVNDGHTDSQQATHTLHIDPVSDAAKITGTDTGDVHEGHTYTAPDGSMSGGSVDDRSPDHMHGNIGKLWNDQIHTEGHLTIIDADTGESHAQNGIYQGSHGQVILQSNGDWNYYASIGQDATGRKIDHLGQGESITDTVTVKAADGTTHDIHITIHGDNDRPYCSSEVQLNSGKEDLAQTITTTELLANTVDVDTNDAGQLSIANLHADHGTLVDNKDGTFTFTPDHNFNGKVHFTYDVKDAHGGVTHTGASTTLLPSNDAATLQPTLASNFVTEDHLKSGTSTNELWSGWKNLDIQDIDSPSEAKVTQIEVNGVKHTVPANFAMNLAGAHGTFNFAHSTDGHDKWSYSADNSHAEVQSLSHGDSLTDTITLITADGTRIPLTAKILGTDDHVMIDTPDSLTAALGTAVEDKVTSISGTLLAHDSDSKDSVTFTAGNSAGSYGTLHVDSNGQWHYDLDHSKANVLQQGETKAEGFDITAISTDGSTATKHIEVLVQGSNDKATISVASNPDVHEDSSSTPVEIISGKLSALDPDHDQSTFSTDVGKRHDPFNSGVHGGLHISKDGSWTYTVNNSQIQQLAAGQEEHVQYNVHTVGGDYHVIDIKIVGSNDDPVLSVTQTTPTTGTLTETDVDVNDTHTFSVVSSTGQFGSLSVDPDSGAYIYKANGSVAGMSYNAATHTYHGTDVFEVKVADNHGGESSKFITFDANGHVSIVPGQSPTISTTVPSNPLVTTTQPSLPAGTNTPPNNAVTVDLAASSDTGTSDTDNLTKDSTPTIIGHTDIPYSQVTIYDASTPIGHAVSDGSGQYSVAVSSLSNGDHNLSAKALAPSSVLPATSSILSLHIDTVVAPLQVSLTHDTGSNSSDLITGDGSLTITGQETGATVEYSTDNGHTWTSSFTPQSGSNTVSVRQTDTAGNVSIPTSLTFTYDDQIAAPSIDLKASTDSGVSATDDLTNIHTPIITGSAEANSSIYITDETGKVIATGTANSHGIYQLTTSDIAEGKHTLTVSSTDAAGNQSSASLPVEVDYTAPTISKVNLGKVSTHQPTFSGSVSLDTTSVDIVVKSGGTIVETLHATLDGKGGYTVDAANLPDQSYTAYIQATDKAGNTTASGYAGAFDRFTIDTHASAPSISFENTGADNIYNAAEVASGAASTITSTIHLPSDAQPKDTLTINGHPHLITHAEHLAKLVNVEVAPGASITASITDQNGNTSTVTNATAPSSDITVAPLQVSLTHDTGGNSSDSITNDGSLTITGQEAGATVEYSTNNGHTWTSSFTPQQGSNTVNVRQTDAAGNISPDTSVTFTLDNTIAAPAVSLRNDTGRHSVNTPDLITKDSQLTIQTEAGAKVEYSNDGGHTWTAVFNPVEGVNDLQVRQTDIAGNVSPVTHFSFTLDTTPGTITVNPISQDNALNAAENNQPLVITGTTSNIAPGDVVYVVIGNKHFYDATVKPDGTWSLTLGTSIHQNIMATDRDYSIQVGTVDTAGNSTPRISTHLLVDTQSPIPHIAVDSVTQDNVLNALESGQTIAITGTVTGDYHTGDIVSLKVNGATITSLTGSVDSSGHFSIPVAGNVLEHANIHTSYANGQSGSIHSIEATIITTDAAGNVGSATTGSQVFSVDTHVNLPTITFENPGPDGLYSKAEIAQGHPNTVTATIAPPSDAKIGEHLVVNGQDHVLDAHILQHGLQIEVLPGEHVQATMTDEHGNTAGSQGVAASAIPEPIIVRPPSGSHHVSGTLGVPPLLPSLTPVPTTQSGWRIHLANGQYVTSHHGQYGTLTIDPQTGDLHYQEQAQVHTGPHGSASGTGQHEDRFEIALQGTNQDEIVAHVNIQILSHGPGNSGKLTVGTEVVDMTITPIVHASHPAPPPPPPVQHDEPEITSHEDFTFTVSDDTSLDLSQHAHQEPDQKTNHHGAAAYLDALGIQPNTSPTTGHDQPADMDIVLAQVDQQHAADYDQPHLDMSDALEHHDAANNHNQDDEHHHHNDVDGLPDIDPNN
ncbi:VCBS domain-containing protein [Vibrio pomeroyi]|uniref:VCBS domain-containing protein n=1 Tax=Vibrio pomeroyi TaxID=198832 RepID=UPI0035A5B599